MRERFKDLAEIVGVVEAVVTEYPAMRPLWRRELDKYPGLVSFEFYARAREALGE